MGGSSGGGGGGGGPRRKRPAGDGGEGDRCPSKFRTTILGPAQGIQAGTWLDLHLDKSANQTRIVLLDMSTRQVVGALGAVPNLDVIIECLDSGTEYRAHVETTSGGRIDITVIKQ